MDGTITFSKGIVFWTTERMNSDEFILFSLKSYLASMKGVTNVVGKANSEKDGAAVSDTVRIVRETGKKPYLSPRIAEFSLTHTEGFLAVAFCDIPVGIDVENRLRFRKGTKDAEDAEQGEIPLYRKIAERYFGVPVKDEESFFKLWTKREATSKRDEMFFLKREKDDGGTTEFYAVGDYLIAVAY